MGVIYVRVVDWTCDFCRDELLKECRRAGLELPTSQFATIPEAWATRTCPHGKSFRLDVIGPSPIHDLVHVDGDVEDARSEDLSREGRGRPWWRETYPETIDASKGIGYPAREGGRYGSYPQHDGSDD
jgi:hypothetical protein